MPDKFLLNIVGDSIVIVGRKHRSKFWGVTCSGCGQSKRRRDGSCKHERAILEVLKPEIKRYARIASATAGRRDVARTMKPPKLRRNTEGT